MLLKGDYLNGWKKYEARAKRKGLRRKSHALPNCKEWNGEILKKNTELLLVTEQGYGDTLQFIRFALFLKKQGINVSICAQPKLHSLIKASGIDSAPLSPEQASRTTTGLWTPLLSVPMHLNVSPDNPITTEPYLKTTDELNDKWKSILSEEKRPIIGINWQGNPEVEKSTQRGRSLPLETFSAVANRSQASLLSLQKGFGSEQLKNCSFQDKFVGCQGQINDTWDFLETAAIIANCDLIITSDTSVAHLAGSIGKPTWLLLKKTPDWRWGLEGETTFWYPSVRLFRQSKKGNWDEVLQRVSNALEEEFGSSALSQKISGTTEPTNQVNSRPKTPISFFHDYRNSIFEAHANFALKTYLNPLCKAINKASDCNGLGIGKDRQILIADNRPSSLLRFCALNSLLMTGFKYKCLVYTDEFNIKATKELFSDYAKFIEIKSLGAFGVSNLNRITYNNLLKDSKFWKTIVAKSVLVTQQDALMIEPLPDDFFKYDYIGAPWNPNKTFSISFPKYTHNNLKEYSEDWRNLVMNPNFHLPVRVGNGGHSIRSVKYMTEISSSQSSEGDEPEDIFYARHRHLYYGCFPSCLEAKRFCTETSYSFSYNSHASHLYLDAHHQAEIYERHIKHLAALYSANCQ